MENAALQFCIFVFITFSFYKMFKNMEDNFLLFFRGIAPQMSKGGFFGFSLGSMVIYLV
jgi:hypothetical protein